MARMLLVVGVVAACVALVSASCVKFCNHPNGRPGKYLCCDENPGRCPPVRDECPAFAAEADFESSCIGPSSVTFPKIRPAASKPVPTLATKDGIIRDGVSSDVSVVSKLQQTKHILSLHFSSLLCKLEMARMLLVVTVAAVCVALVSASCVSFCQDPFRPRENICVVTLRDFYCLLNHSTDLILTEKPGRCPSQPFHCHGSNLGDRPCHFDPECPSDLKCCLNKCIGAKICQIPARY
ncbi:hypothetical protein Pcinc_023587 [Petrolisthes cinctipes]|uniref:WAP domain-containing protein n=1 Tax=Petrolisthes cinctipes TaxID=88211 RepID=A0AAE1FE42_PETCI|nr:hypothetical protein Pcinc_023587 [Petrolisthes cinctipes]